MLGDVVPDPHSIDPHINLNDQPWSLPVVTQGNTMSLRFTQSLDAHWQLQAQALQQRLVSNDHLAFDFGANAACDPCDRFASDGTYAIYDFRSDDERRTDARPRRLAERRVRHRRAAPRADRRRARVALRRAASTTRPTTSPASATSPAPPSCRPRRRPTSPNVDRTERNTELYLRDTVQIGADWSAWGGVRHTTIHRTSWETSTGDPTADTDYTQSFTTPWLAVSRQLGAHDMVYVSWGEGVESDIVPTHGYPDGGQAAVRRPSAANGSSATSTATTRANGA